jgi:hypothetical protein
MGHHHHVSFFFISVGDASETIRKIVVTLIHSFIRKSKAIMRSSSSRIFYSSRSLLVVVVVTLFFLQTAHAFARQLQSRSPTPRTFGTRQQRLGKSVVARYLSESESSENQVDVDVDVDVQEEDSSSPRSHAADIFTSPLVSFLPALPQNYTLVSPAADILELQADQRLVCIGDVHGDLQALQEFLTLAGVYSKDNDDDDDGGGGGGGIQWTGGNTILVQCGDILDRGSEELACFSLLTQLSQLAGNDGGQVICLFGNHEALNTLGLFQYATSDSEYERLLAPSIDQSLDTRNWRIQYVGNQPARWAAYEPGGLLANSLLAHMKVAVQVGRTVCVHAGLTVEHLNDNGGISGMNQQAQEWVRQVVSTNVTYNNQGNYTHLRQAMVEANARQQHYIDTCPAFLSGGIGASSPVWMRDYSSPNDMPPKNVEAQRMIDAALAQLNVDRMVMGHTVQRQINGALNGKAWRIDVGASRGVTAGTPEVLQVQLVNGTEVVTILTKNGKVPARERQLTAFVNML